jgi:hypothetical protein
MFWLYVRYTSIQAGSIVVKAGTGANQTLSFPTLGDQSGFNYQDAPWDSGDSGDVQITITSTQVSIGGISVFDLPRASLSSGEMALFSADATHSRIGHVEGLYLAESDNTGPHGAIQQIYNAWDEFQPQIVGWSVDDTNAFTTTSTSYQTVLGTNGVGGNEDTFEHQARQKKSGTTVTTSRWHIYSKTDASTEYKLKVTSGSDAVESATLSNTSFAWQTALTGLEIDNSATDDLTVEVKRVSGAGTVYVSAVSGIEDS